jgi:adenylyl-sulfate kinase
VGPMPSGGTPRRLTRERRWALLGQRGATVWITGLPAAGKSTLATLLEERLVADGHFSYLFDGHDVRHGLSGDLDFTREARSENVRRAAHVARLLADAGGIAIVALISPFADDRALAREIHASDGLAFFEVFVDTPVEECERRDPKGLYARARAGRLPGFTGIEDPYEQPQAPDVTVETLQTSPTEGVEIVLDHLRENEILGPTRDTRSV